MVFASGILVPFDGCLYLFITRHNMLNIFMMNNAFEGKPTHNSCTVFNRTNMSGSIFVYSNFKVHGGLMIEQFISQNYIPKTI